MNTTTRCDDPFGLGGPRNARARSLKNFTIDTQTAINTYCGKASSPYSYNQVIAPQCSLQACNVIGPGKLFGEPLVPVLQARLLKQQYAPRFETKLTLYSYADIQQYSTTLAGCLGNLSLGIISCSYDNPDSQDKKSSADIRGVSWSAIVVVGVLVGTSLFT
jgi:hypothetical protein